MIVCQYYKLEPDFPDVPTEIRIQSFQLIRVVSDKLKKEMNLFIFHRDLRLIDNTALIKQLKAFKKITPVFIFPPEQIDPKQNKYFSHNSVQFMIESLKELAQDIEGHSGELYFLKGRNLEVLQELNKIRKIQSIAFNLDYTPFAKQRDKEISEWAHDNRIHLIAEEDYGMYKIMETSILNPRSQKPYLVFTPFRNHCQTNLSVPKPDSFSKFAFESFNDIRKSPCHLQSHKLDSLYEHNEEIAVHGGRKNALKILEKIKNFKDYNKTRNSPSLPTTRLSAYLHFTTVSIREVYHAAFHALGLVNNIINEIHWREFYYNISHHFPKVLSGQSFQAKFDAVQWKYNEEHLQAWKDGRTGFPIVDAAMHELNRSGYMHNRCRMIVASFFSKDLFLDWHEGERYFASKLTDYSPMQNSGGWQWTVGNGTDAAPYFRIFNPWTQQKNYDEECVYIKKWLPELKDVPAEDLHKWPKTHEKYLSKGVQYCRPIIDHDAARKQTLALYKQFLNK